jgi:hypothetical protein
MFMARKPKTKNRPRRKREVSRTLHERVKIMAALGHSEDRIAHELGIHKNSLRARFVKSLDAGREIARAEAAAVEHNKLSAREQEVENALNAGFDADGNATGYWRDEKSGGNLLAFTCKTRAEFDAYRAQLAAKKSDEEP